MVMARLLRGDIESWDHFKHERENASRIHNHDTARRVSAQIGFKYPDLRKQTQNFMSENFEGCGFPEFAKLCDEIPVGIPFHMRLDEFERKFFPIKERVKQRYPFYCHISISPWGLGFEYPEHHFLRDLESALEDMAETSARLDEFNREGGNPKEHRDEVADLVARERFLSRSVISASFSLLEAYLSGLFYMALESPSSGRIPVDEKFRGYARTKESEALHKRLDRVVKWAFDGLKSGQDLPYRRLIEFGKPFRDAIHHTTPFERRDLAAGQRLEALYSIDTGIALDIAALALRSILTLLERIFGTDPKTAIAERCEALEERILQSFQERLAPEKDG